MIDRMGHEFAPGFTPPTLVETTGERKIFYRLSESDIFNYANKMSTINGQKLVDVIPRMLIKDQGFLQVAYGSFDKSLKYELFEGPHYNISCKKAMREKLENGDVVMVYSDTWKIPTSIPFVVRTGATNQIFVNISDFVNPDSYGTFNVLQIRNYNGLMAILFAACAASVIVNMKSTLPADIADAMVLMHAAMTARTINSLLHMDPVTNDKVRYLATQFALVQMYGTSTGVQLFQRYRGKFFPKLSSVIMDSIDNQFQIDCYDSLSRFIEELKRIYPSMKTLSLTAVFDKWIRSFGAATALAIDYLGYQLYTMCMVLFESPLISRPALEPMLDRAKGADSYKRLQYLIETN